MTVPSDLDPWIGMEWIPILPLIDFPGKGGTDHMSHHSTESAKEAPKTIIIIWISHSSPQPPQLHQETPALHHPKMECTVITKHLGERERGRGGESVVIACLHRLPRSPPPSSPSSPAFRLRFARARAQRTPPRARVTQRARQERKACALRAIERYIYLRRAYDIYARAAVTQCAVRMLLLNEQYMFRLGAAVGAICFQPGVCRKRRACWVWRRDARREQRESGY